MIHIKSREEILKMRNSAKLLSQAFQRVKPLIQEGKSTFELDKVIREVIEEGGGTPSFLNYQGFPASSCISVNDVVIHGIPSKDVRLHQGDIVSIDIGVLLDGYHADAARTYPVGIVSEDDQRLIDVTKQSFFEGLKQCQVGFRLVEISKAIQRHVESHGFSVVRDFTGHGVGTRLHEDPAVYNYETNIRGPKLQAGMVLAIEPMVNAGKYDVRVLSDGWTTKTLDRTKSAHYEHSVAILEDGPRVLTGDDEEVEWIPL
ncbi:type I methionyl aminopeptidase [Guggenheimella bovis]